MLYVELANEIREQVRSGILPPGSFLPSMRKLQKQYGLSLNTIAQAVKTLADEKLIVRGEHARHGYRVSFVAPEMVSRAAEAFSDQGTVSAQSRGAPAHGSGRPTSSDVAELAGVSRTTVSYVINGKSGGGIRISEDTRRKVWNAVRTLNYRPIIAARMLRTNKSNMIAVMLPQIETPFATQIATQVQREVDKAGFDLLIYGSEDSYQKELGFVQALAGRGVDGLIVQSNQLSSRDLDTVVKAGIAVVVIGNIPKHPQIDNVMFDESRAAKEAVLYLIDKGHRRIGTIAGPEGTWYGKLRKQGYISALHDRGLEVDEQLIVEADFYDGAEGSRCMKRLMSLPQRPTAVFAASDFIAVHALLYATDSGLSVPGDVAIVGFDDLPLARYTRPQLTTVRKSVETMCEVAVRLLKDRVEGGNSLPARSRMLDHEIVRRDSA